MSGDQAKWTILIHGGAKTIAPEDEAANREGLDEAIRTGARVLGEGGTALAAVEAAIRVMEDRPVFNAGLGSVTNCDGNTEMDAGLMDGATLDIGAVAAVAGVAHPVSVARELLGERETLLVGNGALAFARDRGAEMRDQMEHERLRLVVSANEAHDTVGAVALDRYGDLAAGTSTGGLEGTFAGRVGDSPLPGCGFYADNEVGAVSLSGDGEAIARLILGVRIIDAIGQLGVEPALEGSLARITRLGAEAGAIALDPSGNLGFAHNSSHFAVALLRAGQEEPDVWLKTGEGPET